MNPIHVPRHRSAVLEPVREVLIIVALVTGIIATLIHIEIIPIEPADDSQALTPSVGPRSTAAIHSAGLSSDGKTLVAFGMNRGVVVRDLTHGGGPVNCFEPPIDCEHACSAAVSHDGRMLLVGYGRGEVVLWPDVRMSAETVVLEQHRAEVYALAFSPDNRFALTGASDGKIDLWDLPRHERRYRMVAHPQGVRCMQFLPGGRRFVTAGSDGRIAVWETETGELLQEMHGHTWVVIAMALSPDFGQVASTSLDGTVRLWDLESGDELWRADHQNAPVRSVAFSPDGAGVVCGGREGQIVVRCVATGEIVNHLDGHERTVRSLQFFPDGRHLLSAGYDGTVRRWNFDTGTEVERLLECGWNFHQPEM